MIYVCKECRAEFTKWSGQCAGCGAWNSLEENVKAAKKDKRKVFPASSPAFTRYRDLPLTDAERIETGIQEFDRVLGGGAVPGSLVLLGGEPGVGKSTILLQASEKYASGGLKVLYVSGEESSSQIRIRGERLGINSDNLFFLAETDLENILNQIDLLEPQIVVIDSIQTVRIDAIERSAGSIIQIRETASALLDYAKRKSTVIFITGHITKEGLIAGPKSIEHIADSVLYFEGEKNYRHRIIRTTKNRFGPAGELGIFEMRREGLVPVKEASSLFIGATVYENPGAVVLASHEGTRPLLVEIQSLVSQPGYSSPRRNVVSLDYNRAILVMAVLEKRLGVVLSNREVFISAAGGIFVGEPAADLAIAAAVLSSYFDKPVKERTVLFGELGLTGEIREVGGIEARIKEAVSHKFDRIISPKSVNASWERKENYDIIDISNLSGLCEYLF